MRRLVQATERTLGEVRAAASRALNVEIEVAQQIWHRGVEKPGRRAKRVRTVLPGIRGHGVRAAEPRRLVA